MKYYKAKMPEAWARIKWCREQFGPQCVNKMRWYRDRGYLYFRDEQDYLLYLLRWA